MQIKIWFQQVETPVQVDLDSSRIAKWKTETKTKLNEEVIFFFIGINYTTRVNAKI